METNPYAPPKATVGDVLTTERIPAFFPVSCTKLVVMSTTTLGLYEVFWFYKNWTHVRANGGEALPLIRALFAIFFCYALFRRVRRHRPDLPSSKLYAGPLALGWVVFSLASGVTGGTWTASLVSLVLSYSCVLFLVPVQRAVNAINRAERPDHDPNDRFTVWNALWIAVGAAVTVATLSEVYFPEL